MGLLPLCVPEYWDYRHVLLLIFLFGSRVLWQCHTNEKLLHSRSSLTKSGPDCVLRCCDSSLNCSLRSELYSVLLSLLTKGSSHSYFIEQHIKHSVNSLGNIICFLILLTQNSTQSYRQMSSPQSLMLLATFVGRRYCNPIAGFKVIIVISHAHIHVLIRGITESQIGNMV